MDGRGASALYETFVISGGCRDTSAGSGGAELLGGGRWTAVRHRAAPRAVSEESIAGRRRDRHPHEFPDNPVWSAESAYVRAESCLDQVRAAQPLLSGSDDAGGEDLAPTIQAGAFDINSDMTMQGHGGVGEGVRPPYRPLTSRPNATRGDAARGGSPVQHASC